MNVSKNSRIPSLDILRGLAMVLMALDHSRHFFLVYDFDLTNLDYTNPFLFFIRWVSHICAPAFIMLSGISIYLMQNNRGKKLTSSFLVRRGILLVILEMSLITLFWYTHFSTIQLQVIWVIGISFVLMAAFIYLPLYLNAVLSISMLIISTIYSTVHYNEIPLAGEPLKSFLLVPGNFNIPGVTNIDVLYNVIPWFAIMLGGYCLGPVFNFQPEKRRKYLAFTAFLMLAVFLILRIPGIFGDPVPWAENARGQIYTVLSFINLIKYPPSLLFVLLMLSFSVFILLFLDKVPATRFKTLRLLGQTAMFFYLVHIPFIRICSKIYYLAFNKVPSIEVFLILYVLMLLPVIYICRIYRNFKFSKKSSPGYQWLNYI